MRVLLVANTLPPRDVSGVGEQVLQLASGLRRHGHEVEVLGRAASGVLASKSLFPLTVIAPCARRLRSFRPHVVQMHESDGALAAFVVSVLKATLSPRPKLVALLQVSYVEERRAVRALRWQGRVLGRPGPTERRFRWLKAPVQVLLGCLTAWLADLVLAPSARTAGEISRDYGVSEVGVVPNVTGGVQRDAARRSSRSDDSRNVLLFVGRLRIRKGVEVLLEAVGQLAKEHSSWRLLIVGDGEQRQPLEKMVSARGLGSFVDFAGRRSPEEVRLIMSEARALVVPSLYEGMPLVILEAMKRGLPVVASAVSGIPEVVEHGTTGWLVPPEDPERLERALRELIEEPAEARRRGSAGKARAEKFFTPEVAAACWEKCVRTIVTEA